MGASNDPAASFMTRKASSDFGTSSGDVLQSINFSARKMNKRIISDVNEADVDENEMHI
jgi:hypothetical protein